MYITSLKLKGFRNLKATDFRPARECNIIIGANAQGKTNLLESIYYCAFGKSHRQKTDDGVISFKETKSVVSCDYVRDELRHNISVYLQPKQKKIAVDNNGIKRHGELIGKFPLVMFCPDDLTIVKGSPAERRRFIDRGLSQLYPKYLEALISYNIALKNRNADLRGGGQSLDAWDEQLCFYGVAINNERKKYIENISALAGAVHKSMVKSEKLCLSPDVDDALLTKDGYATALAKNRERDLRLGATTVGPHKDDIIITLNNNPAKLFASQGQQRTVALSMKLAELDYIKNIIGESPILLLDDVMSELDKTRQEKLIKQIAGIQSFITTTHIDLVHKGEIFTMKNGVIT